MKRAWPQAAGQMGLFPDVPAWVEPLVLLEYDGPKLVILKAGDQEYLALAVDSDPHVVRWLVAPISHLERDGLLHGGVSVRSAISKEHITIADYDHESQRAVAGWRVPLEAIPESVLPEHGVTLPIGEEDEALSPVVEHASFDLDADETGIAFGALAAITSRIQGLWNALAQWLDMGMQTLNATALADGSLRLQVQTTNADLFAKVAERYRDLIVTSDDTRALQTALADAPELVRDEFRKYLRDVGVHKVEVLARWGDDAAYLSHAVAGRVRAELEIADHATPVRVTEQRFRGYFEGFWPKGKVRFAFHDVDTGQSLHGPIDKELRKQMAANLQLTLDKSQMYIATILVESRGDVVIRYTLKAYERPATSH